MINLLSRDKFIFWKKARRSVYLFIYLRDQDLARRCTYRQGVRMCGEMWLCWEIGLELMARRGARMRDELVCLRFFFVDDVSKNCL